MSTKRDDATRGVNAAIGDLSSILSAGLLPQAAKPAAAPAPAPVPPLAAPTPKPTPETAHDAPETAPAAATAAAPEAPPAAPATPPVPEKPASSARVLDAGAARSRRAASAGQGSARPAAPVARATKSSSPGMSAAPGTRRKPGPAPRFEVPNQQAPIMWRPQQLEGLADVQQQLLAQGVALDRSAIVRSLVQGLLDAGAPLHEAQGEADLARRVAAWMRAGVSAEK